MLERIEADAPKPPCCVVAETMSDEAVRGFMKGDGDDYRDDPDRHQINHIRGHCSNPVFRLSLCPQYSSPVSGALHGAASPGSEHANQTKAKGVLQFCDLRHFRHQCRVAGAPLA